jgi:23S rRNA (cytosine1962-C5)-methyltransferase
VDVKAILRLKPGREKSVLRHHPWIFSGAVADVSGSPSSGDTVDIQDSNGNFLCRGAYSPLSQIRARIWSWDETEIIYWHYFQHRIEQAVKLRMIVSDLRGCNAYRLIHGESDGLPGLIVDRYADWLVVQFLASGVERWRAEITNGLMAVLPVFGIYERSDVDVRNLEGLQPRSGLLMGEEPPQQIRIEEHGLSYKVDIRAGHKTGFYLDQRANRSLVRQISAGKEVLDCFCYTGGFSIAALAGGAKNVVAVDVSPDALQMADENIGMNKLPIDRIELIDGDVFQVLRGFRDARKSYDLVILDPPKFASSSGQVERAARGYKDINLLALKLLRPGGILITFSCSGGVSADLFQKIVAGAALDAQAEVQIVDRVFQPPDHPVSLNFPEGAYLKGLMLYKKPG